MNYSTGKRQVFQCDQCKTIVVYNSNFTTGYGIDPKTEEKICYDCCAENDKKYMVKHGKTVLYLTIVNNGTSNFAKVSNWPGTLVFNYLHYKIGGHNWGLKRYDVWFVFNNHYWHGYTIGDNTQICHCKQTKEKVL